MRVVLLAEEKVTRKGRCKVRMSNASEILVRPMLEKGFSTEGESTVMSVALLSDPYTRRF
jgi:hypothetical protein